VIKTFRDSLSLLATRRFGTFWFASLLSSIGTWAQQVAQPWLLLTLGASSFLIGLDSFAMNAPVLALTLAGGILADRSDRRRVIAFFQSIQMLCPTAIVILLLMGSVKPWMIIALSVVVGVTDALSMPSFSSIVPSIVTREQIGAGLALNSTQFSISRILGPTIAGVLMSSVGALWCFVISAVSYIPFVGVALWILPKWTPPAKSTEQSARAPLLAGIREILRDPKLRGALLTVLATGVLCGPLVTFIPVLVKNVFHGSAGQFSMAMVAFGAGGLVGATALLSVSALVDRRRLSSGFGIAFAVILVLTALTHWYWTVPPLLVFAGASMTVSNIASNVVLQTRSNPALLGRTVSLYMLSLRGGLAVGALITGATVTALGVQNALLINGVLAVVAQTVVARSWLKGS
jgi:predicted MFS family arabinose efflux permease